MPFVGEVLSHVFEQFRDGLLLHVIASPYFTDVFAYFAEQREKHVVHAEPASRMHLLPVLVLTRLARWDEIPELNDADDVPFDWGFDDLQCLR